MLPSVIIEGPDGSGKTTAACLLVDAFGYNYRHDGPPPSDISSDSCLDYYYILLESFPRPVVWDRSIYGELVYGPLFRGKSRLTTFQVDAFMADFRAAGGASVLLLPSVEKLRRNFSENFAAQRKKSVEPSSSESRLVKTTLIRDPATLERVVDGYAQIMGMFDYVYQNYTNTRDWVMMIKAALKRSRRSGGEPFIGYRQHNK